MRFMCLARIKLSREILKNHSTITTVRVIYLLFPSFFFALKPIVTLLQSTYGTITVSFSYINGYREKYLFVDSS